jgi:plastocyanin/uncharacterized membrane protein
MSRNQQDECGDRSGSRALPITEPSLHRKSREVFFAALVVAFLSTTYVGVRAAHASSSGARHVVVLKQVRFDPQQIAVNAGDTVDWENQDIFSHTVTANDGSFDSGLIEPGHSWQMTFKNPGTIAYHCRPHPNMAATLVVQGANGQRANDATGSAGTLRWSPPRTPDELHPILVNFTAALLPLALLSDILGRIFRRQSFHHAAWWMVFYAALVTPLTAAAGWWWKVTQGSALPAKLITVHQWLGTTAVALFAVLAIWRWAIHKREASPSFVYLTFTAIVVLALVYQGSLGGRMVFGK